jgi:hypothetical protein
MRDEMGWVVQKCSNAMEEGKEREREKAKEERGRRAIAPYRLVYF